MDTEIFANKIIDFDEYKGIEEINGWDTYFLAKKSFDFSLNFKVYFIIFVYYHTCLNAHDMVILIYYFIKYSSTFF